MDETKIKNTEARRFFKAFLVNREINRQFYIRIPEEQFDYRMVDAPTRKSDSPI